MEFTVMATSLALSIGLGLAGTHLMMSVVFSFMTRSALRVEEARLVPVAVARPRRQVR